MPTLTVVAGPNGSGKSTITRSFQFEGHDKLLDPDAIARNLNPADPTRAQIAAARAVLSLTEEYLRQNASFVIETTLSSPGRLALIRRAKALGYTVHLYFVALDSPERCITRIQGRVAQGGHFVPDGRQATLRQESRHVETRSAVLATLRRFSITQEIALAWLRWRRAANRAPTAAYNRTHMRISLFLACAGILAAQPAGFTNLFDGKDLKGWRGRPGGGGVFSPYVEAKFTPEERAAKQAEWNADRDLHWRVDAAKGELVSDGKGVHLATEKPYGDFEFRVDWMLTQPCGDSGVYLRDYPQVQIWDPGCAREQRNGADKGSGGLWNDNADNPGKFPLVKADKPIGEWNTLAIKMAGTRVWVTLNGKEVVVGQVLDNYFDRAQPVLPAGSIELQTHGSEVRFRNVYVREIPPAEAKSLLASVGH
jgi:predicted ABC-type ATPase